VTCRDIASTPPANRGLAWWNPRAQQVPVAGDTHAAGPATSCATSPWPGTQAAQHRKVTHMTTPSTG